MWGHKWQTYFMDGCPLCNISSQYHPLQELYVSFSVPPTVGGHKNGMSVTTVKLFSHSSRTDKMDIQRTTNGLSFSSLNGQLCCWKTRGCWAAMLMNYEFFCRLDILFFQYYISIIQEQTLRKVLLSQYALENQFQEGRAIRPYFPKLHSSPCSPLLRFIAFTRRKRRCSVY